MAYQSIPHMFFDVCQKYDKPNAVMVKEEGAYKSYSHKFFRQRVSHLARGLMALGVKADDHVAILGETRFEWGIADMAIVSVGAASVPLYPSLPPDQVCYILDNSESIGIIVSTLEQAEKVLKVKDSVPNIEFIIVMDEVTDLPDGVVTMKAIESKGANTDNENQYLDAWKACQRDDLLTIIYTSGTTGNPKGVMLTHENLLANIEGIEDVVDLTPDDVCLSHLPLSHVLERMAGWFMMLANGITIAYAENIQTMAENLEEVKPTVMVSVPRLFEKIYARIMDKAMSAGFPKKQLFSWALGVGKQALPYILNDKEVPGWLGKKYGLADKLVFSKIREKTGGRMRFLVSGGAPLPKEIGEFFLSIGLKILEGYGLTETSPVLNVNRPGIIRPGTVGPVIKNVEIKIAEDGEILARGPNIMIGYYRNPEATKEVMEDGWFRTGDVGLITEEGCLKITDRKKEILVTSGGKNIAPQPIENALKLSPLIENAVAIGDKRKFISALIVPPWETVAEWAPKNGWPTDPDALVAHEGFRTALQREVDSFLKDFAHHEMVKKFEILPNAFSEEGGELTPSLKIKRRVINEKYGDIIEKMYAD